MTDKLSELEKMQNKMRRQALTQVKKLLKNKKTLISITNENDFCDFFVNDEPKIFDTGMRKLILEWTEPKKRGFMK